MMVENFDNQPVNYCTYTANNNNSAVLKG